MTGSSARLLDERGQLHQARAEPALALGVRAMMLRESDDEHSERGELGA